MIALPIERKLQQSLIAWLRNTAVHGAVIGVATDIREFEAPKTDSGDPTVGNPNYLKLPAIIVEAQTQAEPYTNLAVYVLQADITYRVQADTIPDAEFARVAKCIEDILHWDLAAALTTNALELQVDGVMHRSPGKKVNNDRHWDYCSAIVVGAQSTFPRP